MSRSRKPRRVPLQLNADHAFPVTAYIEFASISHVLVVYLGTLDALVSCGALPAAVLPLPASRRYSKTLDEAGEPIWIRGHWGKPPPGCAQGEIKITRFTSPVAPCLPGVTRRLVDRALEQCQAEDPRHAYNYVICHKSAPQAAGAKRPCLYLVVDNTRREVRS